MPATVTQLPTALLEVSLPVCPLCRNTGKLPLSTYGGKSFCGGRPAEPHKRTQMLPRKFREVGQEAKA